MKDLLTEQEQKVLDAVESVIAVRYRITPEDLHSATRQHHVARPRFMVWYILKKYFGWNYSTIARAYKKDHTTIMHGVSKAEHFGGIGVSQDIMQTLAIL